MSTVPTLKEQLILQLEKLPGVSHQPWPDRTDGFSTIHCNGKEIAHFHGFNELDLKLGKHRIAQEGLKHNPNSIKHPKRAKGSNFIEIRFEEQTDLATVVRLVKLAVEDSV